MAKHNVMVNDERICARVKDEMACLYLHAENELLSLQCKDEDYYRNEVYDIDVSFHAGDIYEQQNKLTKSHILRVRYVKYQICATLQPFYLTPMPDSVLTTEQRMHFMLNDRVPYNIYEALRYSLNNDAQHIINIIHNTQSVHYYTYKTALQVAQEHGGSLMSSKLSMLPITSYDMDTKQLSLTRNMHAYNTSQTHRVHLHLAYDCSKFCARVSLEKTDAHYDDYILQDTCVYTKSAHNVHIGDLQNIQTNVVHNLSELQTLVTKTREISYQCSTHVEVPMLASLALLVSPCICITTLIIAFISYVKSQKKPHNICKSHHKALSLIYKT